MEFEGAAFLEALKEHFAQNLALDELWLNTTEGRLCALSGNTWTQVPDFVLAGNLPLGIQEFVLAQGQRLDPLHPSAGGRLGTEYRWQALFPPLAPEGVSFHLRRHRFSALTNLFAFSDPDNIAANLAAVFRPGKENILVCGPTGSGKTTLLAALLHLFAADQRVLLLEEFLELPVTNPLWQVLRALGGGDFSRLLMESLRLRPDRLIFGEIRGEAQLQVFFSALASGYTGVCGTLHSGSCDQLAFRLDAAGIPANLFRSQLWVLFMERGSPPVLREFRRLA